MPNRQKDAKFSRADRIVLAMYAAKGERTAAELAAALGRGRHGDKGTERTPLINSVGSTLSMLVRQGHVKRIENGPGQRDGYVLTTLGRGRAERLGRRRA